MKKARVISTHRICFLGNLNQLMHFNHIWEIKTSSTFLQAQKIELLCNEEYLHVLGLYIRDNFAEKFDYFLIATITNESNIPAVNCQLEKNFSNYNAQNFLGVGAPPRNFTVDTGGRAGGWAHLYILVYV